ncbi:hypothetical protein ACWOFR_04625 [Carnobacterium gallinarum]|uniref:hypothetical protein n=1 Tax=Carnobacterium gallinarum TaxID=2749 RepID=UPI000552E710|nr:hypothetical protein [Carnobacterium gallinarum]
MNTLSKSFIFSVVILFSILPFKEVFAESTQGYNSTGDISFYGTYEYPKETPEPEPKPEPKPNGKLPVTVNPATPNLNRLPQTGELQNQHMWLTGISFFNWKYTILLQTRRK